MAGQLTKLQYTIASRNPMLEVVYAQTVGELDVALKGFHGYAPRSQMRGLLEPVLT